jgi:hypothetical protein
VSHCNEILFWEELQSKKLNSAVVNSVNGKGFLNLSTMPRIKLEKSKKLDLLVDYAVKYFCVKVGVFYREGNENFLLMNNLKFPPSRVVRRNMTTW